MAEAATYLVTGGAGFIGSHLADALLALGHRVIVIDDLSTGNRSNLPSGAEFHELDIRSSEAADLVDKIRPRAILHHAAQMDVRRSTREPRFDAEVNVLGTLNLLEAAAAAGVGKIVFASTGGAIYGEQQTFPASEEHPCRPVSPYGVSKLACESYLYYFHVEHDLDVTCLRYANVYGERQNPRGEAGVVAIFLERLLTGGECAINGDGLQTRDYIHVSDVVRANLAVLDRTGFEIFNVGTGIETSVVDLYKELTRAVGIERVAMHVPAKPGEQKRSSVDASGLLAQTSWARPAALAEGLRATAAWFAAAHQTEAG